MASTQPAVTGRLLFAIPTITSLRTGTVPPSPISRSVMPCSPRKNASVTMKDGIPIRDTSRAMSVPMTSPVTTAASTASGQLQPLLLIRIAITQAAAPPATPADRSISPSSSTGTSAMASTQIGAAWVIRLAKLPTDGKVSGRSAEKIRARTTRPSTAGRAPMSPPRSLSTYSWTAPRTVVARTSCAKSCPATLAPGAVSCVTLLLLSGVAVIVRPSRGLGSGGDGDAEVARAPRGDELHHAAVVGLRRRDVGRDPAEVQGGDPVGDLEDVHHVVRDEQDPESAVGEPAHQVEHLAGLGDAEGGGRLVEEHDLGVPQHGLGDRHRLSLATREAGHGLPDRLHRPHGQGREGLAGLLLHRVLVQQDAGARLASEKHVLDDVEVVAQREVLVDDLDSQVRGVLRAVHMDRLALEQVLAGVEAVDPGDGLHQGRLARPVVADQRRDLSGVDGEVDVVQHVHGTEALVDAAQLQQRFGHGPSSARSGPAGAPVPLGTGAPSRRVFGSTTGQAMPALVHRSAYLPVQTSALGTAPSSIGVLTLALVMEIGSRSTEGTSRLPVSSREVSGASPCLPCASGTASFTRASTSWAAGL